jgi:hypothetical protein
VARLIPRRSDINVAVSWFAGALFAGATCSAAVTSAGCACTLIAAPEGLLVALSPSPLPDGQYHFEVIADDVPISLVADISAGTTVCDPELGCHAEVELDDGRRLILEFGSWGDDELVILYTGDGVSGPAEAVVTVRRDDVALTTAAFAPEYEKQEPNGRGCGTFWSAHVEMTL